MVRSQNVPNGWTVTLLDSVAERCSGHTPSKSFPEYWNGGIKWISLADSFRLDNGYVYETDKEISQLGIDHSSAAIHPKGTVVLSRDAGVGKSGVMMEPMAVSQHFIAWKCDTNKKVHNWFLYNWLQFHKPTFERQAVGSTIKTIGLPFFKKLKIALPPYDEQRKIAQILSTWDKTIATTEKLIDVSKQQKKALMQQLLTGKKRLVDPETGKAFEGDWKFSQFDELYKVANNKATQVKSGEYLESGRTPIVDQGKSIIGGYTNNEITYKDLPVIVFGDHTRIVKWVDFEFAQGADGTQVLKSHESMDDKFAYYILLNTDIPNLGYSRHMRELKERDFKYPISEAEQQKIASVLTAADEEIKLQEVKLAHFKQEKKALMQQLLTGKRRVKV